MYLPVTCLLHKLTPQNSLPNCTEDWFHAFMVWTRTRRHNLSESSRQGLWSHSARSGGGAHGPTSRSCALGAPRRDCGTHSQQLLDPRTRAGWRRRGQGRALCLDGVGGRGGLGAAAGLSGCGYDGADMAGLLPSALASPCKATTRVTLFLVII